MVSSFRDVPWWPQEIRHLTHPPPDVKDVAYENWFADDCAVIFWMVNSMDKSIAHSVMMLKPAKKIWDTLRSTYGNVKNIVRVCETYK